MSLSERMKHFLSFLNGFRKLSYMVVLLIVAILFRVFEYVSGEEFVDLMSSTTVAFMATNGIEHLSKSVIEWVKGKK